MINRCASNNRPAMTIEWRHKSTVLALWESRLLCCGKQLATVLTSNTTWSLPSRSSFSFPMRVIVCWFPPNWSSVLLNTVCSDSQFGWSCSLDIQWRSSPPWLSTPLRWAVSCSNAWTWVHWRNPNHWHWDLVNLPAEWQALFYPPIPCQSSIASTLHHEGWCGQVLHPVGWRSLDVCCARHLETLLAQKEQRN